MHVDIGSESLKFEFVVLNVKLILPVRLFLTVLFTLLVDVVKRKSNQMRVS
jgi:hypothetical protein